MHTEPQNPEPGCDKRPEDTREPGQRAVGSPRLIPAVTFGLRVAVLAGVVLVSSPGLPQAGVTPASAPVSTTAALGGPLSALGPWETTCCGPS